MPPLPLLTLAICVACVIAFGAESAQDALTNVNTMVRIGALESGHVFDGEYWRMLSCTFLHGGLDHLIGNLLMLYVLGMACEHAYGRSQFLFLYVASGLAGASLSLLGGLPSVGASGAIFGLAGALIVLFRRHRDKLHLRDRRIGLVLGFWAAYQMILGALNPAVDNRAHLGGMLGGMVAGWCLKPEVLKGNGEARGAASGNLLWLAPVLALAYCSYHFVPVLFGL